MATGGWRASLDRAINPKTVEPLSQDQAFQWNIVKLVAGLAPLTYLAYKKFSDKQDNVDVNTVLTYVVIGGALYMYADSRVHCSPRQ